VSRIFWGFGSITIAGLMLPVRAVWCAQKGKRDRGIAILARLNGKIDGYNAEKQYDILSRSAEYEKAKNAEIRKEYWFNVFLGSNLLRLIISTWTTLSFQMLGLGLFLSYASVFYTAAGVDDPFIIVIINNCVTLGSIVPIIIFADKIGRRWVCIIGLGLMWIACLLVGILGVVDKGKVVNALLVLFTCIWSESRTLARVNPNKARLTLFLMVCAPALGLQTAATAAYGYLAETSTQSLREYTAGWAYACSTIFGATWGILIPYMVNEAEWNWNLKTGFFFL
jgi:MFS family permease